jgi:hypothetical protein
MTQRLLGQQSLAEFNGLSVDVDKVREKNSNVEGGTYKGGLLIHSGGKRTKEETARMKEENKRLYGLSAKDIAAIEVPELTKRPATELEAKRKRADTIRKELQLLEEESAELQQQIKLMNTVSGRRRRLDGGSTAEKRQREA